MRTPMPFAIFALIFLAACASQPRYPIAYYEPPCVVVAQRMGAYFGATPLEFEATPSTAYVARAQQDLEGTSFWTRPMHEAGGPTFFWIEEKATGKRVTEQVRVNVNMNGGSTPVPIFIPRGK